MLDEHLKLRAAAEKRIEVVGADGVDRGCARDSERHLESLVGRVPVPRLAYGSAIDCSRDPRIQDAGSRPRLRCAVMRVAIAPRTVTTQTD